MQGFADKIEQRGVDTITPFAGNARVHSDKQVKKIAASIRQFGFNNPILVDPNGVIVAGHGRLAAAKLIGMKTVPVIELPHLAGDRIRRAYTIADNRLAEDATWDEKILARELAAIEEEFDLKLLGFGAKQIDRLLADAQRALTGGEADEDDAPPAPKVPTSRAGDVWLLGSHRLLCGDATNAEHVALCLDGAKPHLMVTDQPYGVEYEPDWRNQSFRADGSPIAGRAVGRVANDGRDVGRVANDGRDDWRAAYELFQGDVAYVWNASLHTDVAIASLEAVGFERRALIIWTKSALVISRGHYHWQHEPCWYAVRKGATAHWCGLRDQSTVWPIEHRKSETGHGTQKPLECMRRPILNNSRQGDFVYEPFSGSGTTLIACEDTKRICRAIEIDPAYVDVAVERWQTFTGKAATHAETGEEFIAVSAARRSAVAA